MSRLTTINDLEGLFKQALTQVPPMQQGPAPQGPPQGPPPGDPAAQGPPPGDPAAQGPPPGMPPQGPPPGDPAAQGAPPDQAPIPPQLAGVIDKVISVANEAKQRVHELESKFEQDKLLRDKDREHSEKRRQLVETILPTAAL